MANDVLPQSNLPPESVQWGRTVENYTVSHERTLTNLNDAVASNNRAMAGQMGVVGRQIQELGSRLTNVISMPSVSVTATSTAAFSSGTGSVTVPGTGSSDRFALLTVTAPVSKTSGNMSGPFITVTFNGSVVFRGTAGQAGGTTPPDWANSLYATVSVIVPAGGATLSITAESQLFVAGAQTATVESPTISVYFSDAT